MFSLLVKDCGQLQEPPETPESLAPRELMFLPGRPAGGGAGVQPEEPSGPAMGCGWGPCAALW